MQQLPIFLKKSILLLLGPYVSNSTLMQVFIWLGVFPGLRGEWQRGAEVHEGDGGLILFAFDTQTVQSMQIDKQ